MSHTMNLYISPVSISFSHIPFHLILDLGKLSLPCRPPNLPTRFGILGLGFSVVPAARDPCSNYNKDGEWYERQTDT